MARAVYFIFFREKGEEEKRGRERAAAVFRGGERDIVSFPRYSAPAGKEKRGKAETALHRRRLSPRSPNHHILLPCRFGTRGKGEGGRGGRSAGRSKGGRQ